MTGRWPRHMADGQTLHGRAREDGEPRISLASGEQAASRQHHVQSQSRPGVEQEAL